MISIGIALCALLFTAASFRRTQNKDTTVDATERATMSADLRYIRQSIEAAINRFTKDTETRSTDESLPVGSRNNFTLLHVLEDPNVPKTDASLEQNTLNDDLIRFMDVLNDREQGVIVRFFGIETTHQTMSEIAENMGIKRERVRQVRDQALRKLRKAAKKGIER